MEAAPEGRWIPLDKMLLERAEKKVKTDQRQDLDCQVWHKYRPGIDGTQYFGSKEKYDGGRITKARRDENSKGSGFRVFVFSTFRDSLLPL